MDTPAYLQIYHKGYFAGTEVRSGYTDYHTCRGVLQAWSEMVHAIFQPTSVLDVGAAYGFLVEYFHNLGIPAEGVEPSEWARSQVHDHVKPLVHEGYLPNLHTTGAQFNVVTCTEVLEHIPTEDTPASLKAMADKLSPGGFLVCLIMLEGPGADGDEGHINLQTADWWHGQLAATGLERHFALEDTLNMHTISRAMLWAGRFFVYRRV